jgi:exosome complex component RRP43
MFEVLSLEQSRQPRHLPNQPQKLITSIPRKAVELHFLAHQNDTNTTAIMTTTTASTGPPSLSFPPSTFAKLSPHPYLLAHLSSDPSRRPNGRLTSAFRTPHVNTGSLTHAEGSAVVRIGDTTAVAGVRGEILLASDVPGHHVNRVGVNKQDDREGKDRDEAKELKDLDLLVPNIELATGCSPAFLPGQPPSMLAQGLSTRAYTLLHESRLVGIDDLRIWYAPPDGAGGDGMEDDGDVDGDGDGEAGEEKAVVKAYWTLYIDVLFISFDGNPFDAAWAATLAALRNVRLPRAYWDVDAEMVLCSDELSESKTLSLRGLPVACTFMIFGTKEAQAGNDGRNGKGKGKAKRQWILADPDTFEEGLCDESVTVVVDCSRGSQGQSQGRNSGTKLLEISKAGGTGVGRTEMRELVAMAEKRWVEWDGVLGSAAGGKT